ncbi:hypothetical protein, partial [Bartonella sp. CL2QHWL]|uniref:hypothetical protein n=1 Tax=Bartonella sp. CL2QHWL TaxID=3243523 RepID=UPI0035CF007A
LRTLGLASTVWDFISHDGWDTVLDLDEPTYRELTLELLSTFKLQGYYYSTRRAETVSFRAFGKRHRITPDQLGVYLGLYTIEFTESPEFQTLHQDFPLQASPGSFWQSLGGGVSKKASQIKSHAHRYIHALLARGVGGRSDSTGVVSRADLLMMYSILERYPIHLGHLFAELISHQATSTRLGAIFAGPYITRLIRGLGLIEHTQGMRVVSAVAPL